MKNKVILAVLFVSCLSLCDVTEAFIFRRRRRTNVNTTVQVNIGSTYQAQAQYKANIMASRGVMSHRVSAMVGSFEGIGMGGSRNCATCTPSRGMTLVADAAAFGHGRWYRVRAWR